MFQYQAVVDTGTTSKYVHFVLLLRKYNVKYYSLNDFQADVKRNLYLRVTADTQNPTYLTRGTFGSVSCRQDLEIPPEPPRPTEPGSTTPDFVGPPGPPGPTVHNLTFLPELNNLIKTQPIFLLSLSLSLSN